MNRLFRTLFIIFGIVVFLLFLAQVWKDYNRPYRGYQETFKQMMAKVDSNPGAVEKIRLGYRQEWVSDLNRADRCETCHLGVDDPRFLNAPQPFTAHPNASVHSFEKFGCTICHGGQGPATTLEDAHGPTENWNTAIYHEDFMQNSCSLCHGENLGDKAPVFSKGQLIFNEYGCRGCHKIKGREKIKVGPPLDEMNAKVKSDWLYRWLRNPKEYLPRTKMPNSKLTEQEAADVAASLLQGGKTDATVPQGDSKTGKTVLLESRCVSCHTIEDKGGTVAPELAKVGSKDYPQMLFRIIQDPHALWHESKMPIFGFPEQTIRDMVSFMSEEYVDLDLDPEQADKQAELVAKGSAAHGLETMEKYGCVGCHDKIAGIKERAELAPELTTIGAVHISRLDFGEIHVPLKDHTVPNWLYNKAKNSRLFKSDLKMPDFSFDNPQAEAVTTYLLSLNGEEVPDSYILKLGNPPSNYAPQGAFGRILDKYRCLVCHKINGKGGEIANDLSQEGSRVREQWILKFMKAPDTIRPMLEERMPPFKILDPENQAIYAYCRATLLDDRVENLAETAAKIPMNDPTLIGQGEKLYLEKYACNACHQIDGKGGLVGPDFSKVANRLRPEWVLYYLHDPKAFVKRSLEPVYGLNDKEIDALTAFLLSHKAMDSDTGKQGKQ